MIQTQLAERQVLREPPAAQTWAHYAVQAVVLFPTAAGAAAHDDAALLAIVTQHVGAGVGTRCVVLVQHGHRPVGPARRHQLEGHLGPAAAQRRGHRAGSTPLRSVPPDAVAPRNSRPAWLSRPP